MAAQDCQKYGLDPGDDTNGAGVPVCLFATVFLLEQAG